MKCTPIIGEQTRFEVVSDKTLRCHKCNREFRRNASGHCSKCMIPAEPATYLQDVVAFWGNGCCTCPRFRINIQPAYERKDFSLPPCHHLLTAFMLFGQAEAKRRGEAPPTL